ncbi:oligosaccharide flippase family protein [Paracoccaceae bacterium]|nr:oligosaccharide flippase family protein [Paracoccaceae bacterium]
MVNKNDNLFALKGLIKVSILPFIIKVVGAVCSFSLSIMLARLLGVNGFGTYSLIISIVVVLSIPVRFGFEELATREISKASQENDYSTIRHFLLWSNRMIYPYTLGLATLAFLLCFFVNQNGILTGIAIAIITVGTLSLTTRNGAMLRGFNLLSKGIAPEDLIRQLAQLLLLLFFLLFAFSSITVLIGVSTFTFSTIVAFLFSHVWLRKELKDTKSVHPSSKHQYVYWRKSLFFMTITVGGQLLFGHIDTLMLGAIGEITQVGEYRAAVQLTIPLLMIITVGNQILQPHLVKSHHSQDKQAMQALVSNSSIYMFLMTFIIGLILIIYATQLLNLTFGKEYVIASTALQVLLMSQIINVFFGPVGTILNMTGLEKEAMIVVVFANIINIILDAIFIPLFGLVGAASASAVSIVLWTIILRYFIRKKLEIESSGILHTLK